MKKEIVIISDLWGKKKSTWMNQFERILAINYTVTFYDSCKLGEIDLTIYKEKNIHQQFVSFGIDKAVSNLLNLEKDPKFYIGCSVGGVIAWKAALLGLPIDKLITISSTRLREEKEKPNCLIQMYFGDLDRQRPDSDWIKSMGKESSHTLKGSHEIYKEELTVTQILKELNAKKWIDL